MKSTSWRPIVVAVVLVAAVFYILPTIHMIIKKQDEPTLLHKKQVNLGLDLMGGIHLVLEVDTPYAVKTTVNRTYSELRRFMRENKIRVAGLEQTDDTTISIKIGDANKLDQAKGLLAKTYIDYLVVKDSAAPNGAGLKMTLKGDEIGRIKKMAAEKALMKIRNRVDAYGAREPDIRPQGENRIIVQLPGATDEKKARREIERSGNLEFKLVDETGNTTQALQGKVPAGSEISYYRDDHPRFAGQPILLKKEALITGEYLSEAKVKFDPSTGEPYVGIKFNNMGSKLFAKLTANNINKRLAIVLDGKVYSDPVIQSKISGEGMITGNFTDDSAKSLALILREAFPTPVKVLYEKTVGAFLGEDSIRKGLFSMLAGGLLVIVFMIIYYKIAGLVANIALIANIFLILGGLAAVEATLTLPGIAGIILTIGMAVDANVLIFERIKEEIRLGKTVRAAVDAGFNRASLTILDANVTTLIAALVLLQFGSGPVQGFAVTLSLGVVSSLFTALILSRSIFDFFTTKKRLQLLYI
ncbi:MAG: protein translocase subunit SecD [Desulfobacteraceae bacterium]|nr:protein translocase subunit SecD [Desulfobacteraceae bacterium]